jgi:dTDP-4-amino-4,6-dideoxygalactose transaminase
MSNIIIPVADVSVGEEEANAVANVVRSGRLSMGPKVGEFEAAFRKYTGAEHAIAVNNGTAALHVALAALGIKPGDEVIVPSLTFISTANAVLYQGATPVLCECDPETYNVRVEDLRACMTKRTRAIIPVEMNGMPVDYDAVLAFANDAGIAVILDSAESLGATYRNRRVGAIAPIHMFSFFPNKIITTGEGGMITTDDAQLAARMRILLNQGQTHRYHHVELGYNYRMTELQAALGVVQMNRIEKRIHEKNRIAAYYNRAFEGETALRAPHVPDYVTQHSWYMYSVQVPAHIRDSVVEHMKGEGIETRLSFPPVHTQPYVQRQLGYRNEQLPLTNRAWAGKIDIPAWPGMSERQLQTVVDASRAALARYAT